jgi:DNA-binding response OmpR family regulator
MTQKSIGTTAGASAAAPADRLEQRVLLHAGRSDEAFLRALLESAGLWVVPCTGEDRLLEEYGRGAGAAVLAEEALPPDGVERLAEALAGQLSWSDFPLLVLAGRDSDGARLATLAPLGNLTVLERPVRGEILLTAVRAALRARRRQYEMRDLLRRMAETEQRHGELLALLGFELRNPLAAIRNALSVLEEEAPDPPLARRQHVVIERQTRHLARLVDGLLDTAVPPVETAMEVATPPGSERRSDERAARPGPAAEPGRHVLIVEDNLDVRESLRDLLELWGHQVEVAASGPEGLSRALVARPEVALLDIGLPGLDGNELARRIRAVVGAEGMRLVAMTGYGQAEDRRRSFDAGFDAYLVKPVDPAQLGRLLSERPTGPSQRASGVV